MTLDPIFQPIKLGTHTVPGIWRYLLPEDVFYFQVDPESRSSCFDCPQIKLANFHPSIRCCAFIPRIPNFLLGMALYNQPTRPMISDYVKAGFAIPEGTQLSPTLLTDSLGHISPAHAAAKSLVCPFLDLDSKACRMYAFRNGVCSTFFCIHDRGDEGILFWEQLQDLISQIETAIAQWALAKAGFNLTDYFARFNGLSQNLSLCTDPHSKAWSVEARRLLFQEWFGRELELFTLCADLVIAHKSELFTLACQQKLLQTKQYDAAAREVLLKTFAPALVRESLPEGEPVAIQDLWYSVQLAHRNLQRSRLPLG